MLLALGSGEFKSRFEDQPFAGGGGNNDNTKGIIASWAVGVAMQVCDNSAPNYDQQVMQYARLALEARRQIKNEVEP